MSSPIPPARPDAESMTAIRGLLERNLLERAVALSETHWPGSGPVVELAHEWTRLSPSVRRERLASIGPEELARLRGLSQLQPDLARVLDDLEARGIIPPEGVVAGDTQADPIPVEPPTFEEAVTDAALDYSEQGLQRLASSVQEDLPPRLEAAFATPTGVTTAATAAATVAEIARARTAQAPMAPVPMPELDLGLPSTGEFLAEEAERRLQANNLANSILERARTRVDDTASRLIPTAVPAAPAPVVEPSMPVTAQAPVQAPLMPAPVEPVITAAVAPTIAPQQSTRVDSPVDRDLMARIERAQVLALEPGDPVPDEAELQAAARSTSRAYVALRPGEMGSRAFFGGLAREGRQIEPRAGAFPTAASQRSLVVVYGRLYPKTIERLRAGYCDIPGTQATVRLHPDCRIVLLPA